MRALSKVFPVLVFWMLSYGLVHSEEILVVDQDYDVLEQKGGGPESKDVRQRLYISPDCMCIDEFSGSPGDETPTESTVIDFKNRQIITLKHPEHEKSVETFDVRRTRIEARKKQTEEDLAAEINAETRKKIGNLYRALLDEARQFTLSDTGETKSLATSICKRVKVLAADKTDYVPLEVFLHQEVELPYDNAEVLYLLEIIGPHMAQFLSEHKATFKYVPMELHLDLACGGRLDTRVTRIGRLDRKSFGPARGTLGDPFTIPEYTEAVKRPVRKTKKEVL